MRDEVGKRFSAEQHPRLRALSAFITVISFFHSNGYSVADADMGIEREIRQLVKNTVFQVDSALEDAMVLSVQSPPDAIICDYRLRSCIETPVTSRPSHLE